MTRILPGLCIVESSAFIAAPYAGMTLAQMGAEVIRVDPIGGGLDYRRWPVTDRGVSLYWAGLNKGKKSVCIDFRKPEGRALLGDLITAAGEGGGIFLTNLPASPPLDYDTLRGRRSDLIMASIYGSRDGATAVDYTVNAAVGFPLVTGPAGHDGPVNHVLPAWDLLTGANAALAISRVKASSFGSRLRTWHSPPSALSATSPRYRSTGLTGPASATTSTARSAAISEPRTAGA
jgi:2-methylfumaryl-CoA isomerase